jgi:hypothetical protein
LVQSWHLSLVRNGLMLTVFYVFYAYLFVFVPISCLIFLGKINKEENRPYV